MFFPIKGAWSARYWDLGDKLIANNSRAGSMSVFKAIVSQGPVVGAMEATKPVYILVRDPVARYVSALRLAHILPESGNHFGLQSDLAKGPEVHVYRFPEQLKEFGMDTGLGEIPWENKTTLPVPTLTEEDRKRVLNKYAPDVALFNSI